MKKIILALIGVLFIFTAFSGLTLGASTGHYDPKIDGLESDIPIIKQAGNVSAPQPVNLYFDGGDGGGLKPEMPEGNATTDVPCEGFYFPRTTIGWLVGIWTSAEIRGPITIDPTVSCTLWAYSTEGANNVRFSVQLLINGDQRLEFLTDPMSLSNTPTRILGSGTGESLQLQTGDTIGARLYYFSDSRMVVGPGADSILVVGGAEYDTHLTITTSSLSVVVQPPQVAEQFTTVSAMVVDAFASTKYIASVRIDGIVDAISISGPSISPGGNGTSVSWVWDHLTDGAKSGEYTITITVSYSEDNVFTSAATYRLEFPQEKKEGGLFGGGGIMDWIIPIIAIVVVVIVIVVVVKFVLGKRAEKASETTEE